MLDKEMALAMKRAGCHTIKFGVESGSQEILERIKKGISLAKAEETYAWLSDMGMRTHAHFMVGHPGETKEDLEQTINLLKRLKATTVSVGILTPYPGTPQFNDLIEQHPQIMDPPLRGLFPERQRVPGLIALPALGQGDRDRG